MRRRGKRKWRINPGIKGSSEAGRIGRNLRAHSIQSIPFAAWQTLGTPRPRRPARSGQQSLSAHTYG